MAAVTTTRSKLFSSLNALAEELQTSKLAAANGTLNKQAGPTPSDPGGYQGASSHPSTSVDNSVQSAPEGSRFKENTSDVKSDQKAPSVENAPEAKPGTNKEEQYNIGTHASSTGEDPKTEDKYKEKKDDPGTTGPFKVGDEKYGSASFKDACAKATALHNEILADLANGLGSVLPAGKTAAAAPAATPSTAVAAQAGYELATQLGLSKDAAFAGVQDSLELAIKEAQIQADLLGGYYQKKAADADDDASGEHHGKPKPGGDDAGGGEGGGAAPSPGGGEPPPAAGGGAPGLDALMGAGGGAGGGGGGGMGDGSPSLGQQPPSQEEALQELAMALQELGIPLDQLAQMGQAGGGGAGGPPGAPPMVAPPMGGAAPPMVAPPMGGGGPPPVDGAKLASVVRDFQLSGKFEIKAAATKRARSLRDHMKNQIREHFLS